MKWACWDYEAMSCFDYMAIKSLDLWLVYTLSRLEAFYDSSGPQTNDCFNAHSETHGLIESTMIFSQAHKHDDIGAITNERKQMVNTYFVSISKPKISLNSIKCPCVIGYEPKHVLKRYEFCRVKSV